MKTLLGISLFISLLSQGQYYQGYNFNDTRFSYNSRGPFFCYGPGYRAGGFRIPKDSLTNTIFSADYWIAAERPNGDSCISAEMYRTTPEYVSGPKASIYDQAYINRWDKTWAVSKAEILEHIENYKLPGYIVPASIASWPGSGDPQYGEPDRVAPFADVNGDGRYTPELGDYPLIRGDRAVFGLRNDFTRPKQQTNANPMGILISTMIYEYLANSNPLKNSVFVHTELLNTGDTALKNIKIGTQVEMDIGCERDDYIGTDTRNDAVYAYNGDDYDQDTSVTQQPGYNENPPFQALMLLSSSLERSLPFNYAFQNSNLPISATDYFNRLHGKDINGEAFPDTYFYPGKPDGTEGVSETSLNNIPGDRSVLAVTSTNSLAPRESFCFDMAFVYCRADSGNHLSGYQVMKDALPVVRNFYNAQESTACDFSLGIKNQPKKIPFKLFPNPAEKQVFIEPDSNTQLETVSLINPIGQTIYNGQTKQIDLENIPGGMYLVKIQTKQGSNTQRLLVK